MLGGTGLTAYFGLLAVTDPKEGETVMVSTAAGAVGHIVGQLAKIRGCRVVGVTGSEAKNARLVDELGFDGVANYRDGGFRQALKEATPDGVDVYFDNTGGTVLGSALFRMNQGGRISCCGVVSQYDTANPEPGPRGIPGLLVNKRLRMEGFLVFDFADRYGAARAELKDWMASGRLTAWVDEFQRTGVRPARVRGPAGRGQRRQADRARLGLSQVLHNILIVKAKCRTHRTVTRARTQGCRVCGPADGLTAVDPPLP